MSDTSESKNPFNKWWFISGGLVLVIAAALVWILAIGPGTANNNNDALPEPGNNSSALPEEPTSSTKPTELAGGECDLDDSDQEIPTEGPAAEWTDYGPVKLPTSEEAGPALQEGSVWSCFAHTPTGALMAAPYFAWGLAWNDYEGIIEQSAVDNAAVAPWLANREELGEASLEPGTAPGVAGFRFESYTGTEAVVQVGLRYGTIERMSRVYLVWDEAAGDWKVDLSKGDPASATNEVTSLANFTPWGATNG
jgi:hypothetical protein